MTDQGKRARGLISAAVLIAGLHLVGASLAPVEAQSNQDIAFADYQLNRSLPGARSLAMGGAFVALADDATAVYSNPAGLVLLDFPEVSFEARHWSFDTQVPDVGRVSGPVTGIGIDTAEGVRRKDVRSSTQGPSFASAVWSDARRRWTVGAFYHRLADFERSFNSEGVFTSNNPRFGPYRSTASVALESFGATGAYEFGNCVLPRRCVRVGLTVLRYEAEYWSRTDVLADPPPQGVGAADFGAPAVATAWTTGKGNSLDYHLGLLWEVSPRWTFGGAIRRGPRFSIYEALYGSNRNAILHFPDEASIGAALHLGSSWTFSLEVDRVRYSQLTDDNGFSEFSVSDATEVRLGAERVVFFGSGLQRNRISVMAGAWLDPNHRFEYRGPVRENIDEFKSAYFRPGGSSQWHGSAGLGINLRSFQLDAGFDYSVGVATGSVSCTYRL